ncbi:UDP-N-acetylglucosamine pyrophosphorylase [Candidatus Zixiibacteriota bacterium]|nr:UDP-N-acetylglucosamine pyrophosphorylase [candidate division Zixibacteria bacterium]
MNKLTAAVILAAGKGTRMKSEIPKVLHRVEGQPLIRHLLRTMTAIPFSRIIVVIGFEGEMVAEELKDFPVEFVWQKDQRGTGHAVMMAEEALRNFDGNILVAAGDVPYLSEKTIRGLIDFHNQNGSAATCLTAVYDDPAKYGRIIREPGTDFLADIIEYKDADETTKKIKEVNTGTFCFISGDLFPALHKIDDNNAQKELYLTDTIKILRRSGRDCRVLPIGDPFEVTGINSVEELAALEDTIRNKKQMN